MEDEVHVNSYTQGATVGRMMYTLMEECACRTKRRTLLRSFGGELLFRYPMAQHVYFGVVLLSKVVESAILGSTFLATNEHT